MDGFRVDISALTQSGAGFKNVGGELANASRRLASLKIQLMGQEFPALKSTMALIETAERQLTLSTEELMDYGDMCEEISGTYEMAERQVLSMVKALGATLTGGFEGTAKPSVSTSSSTQGYLKAAAPVLMNPERLQGEEWLVKRALNDIEERGPFT